MILAEDVLAIRNQGTNAGQIGVSGSDVTFGGVVIGSFTGGSSGSDLVVTFNGNATSVGVTMVMQNITYENTDTGNATIGARTVDFVVTDGDGGTSLTHSATVNVGGLNDAPVLTSGAGGGTHNEGGGTGTYFNNALTITDADLADFDGGVLTTSITANGELGDRLLVRDGGNVSVSGSDVLYDFGGGPIVVGTFSGGDGTNPLVVTFNSNSDATSVEAVAQQVAYRTEIDDPSGLQRTLEMNVTDGDGGTSATATRTMNVIPINDAPILSISSDNPTFTENGSPVGVYSNASVDLVEAADNATAMVISVDGLANGSDEILVIDGQAIELTDLNSETTTTGSYDVNVSVTGATATITITKAGGFTGTDAETILNNLAYNNTAEILFNGTRTITFTSVTDSGGGGDTGLSGVASTVNVVGVNDDPTNVGSLPTDINVTEDVSSAIGLSSIDVSDLDANGLSLTVRLTAANGNLTAAAGTGITIGNNGTSDITLTGTLSDLNSYLDVNSNIQYLSSTANLYGDNADTIQIRVNDNGNSGPGGGLDIDFGTINIDIDGVNDAPVNSVPASATVIEEIATPISGISIGDVDNAGILLTQLQVNNGVLNMTLSGAATISAGANGTGDLTISGSEADINATLASLTYTGDANIFGVNADTLTITTDDQGNFGSGAAIQDVDTVQIDISPVADAPITGDATVSLDEDAAYIVQLSDIPFVDADGDPIDHIQVTQLPANGTLQLSGVNVSFGDLISAADIAANNLVFIPAADDNGVAYDAFEFRVSDGANYSIATSSLSLINSSFTSGSEGFTYSDDIFGTSRPANATGNWDNNDGFSGGGLYVEVGGNAGSNASSGGFSQDINLATDGIISISLRYRLDVANQVDGGEFGEAVFEIDGVRYGADLNNSLAHIEGGGDSGWQEFAVEVALTSGVHTLSLGAFANSTNSNNETIEVYFDDVVVEQQTFNTFQFDVNPINDAPILDNSSRFTLADVNEDDTNSAGNTVAQMIASLSGDRITEVDAGAVEGIAVTSVDDSNGVWEYSLDGTVWLSFAVNGVSTSGADDSNAVLLDAGSHIRFVPNGDYFGSAGELTFRAWDQTDGSSDGDVGVDVSLNGGVTSISAVTGAASLNVAAVNDAPVLGANTLTILEGGTVTLNGSNLSVTDIDNIDSELTYNVSSLSGGQFELVSSPQTAITSFTHAQVLAGDVVFAHDGSESAPAYDISVSDGALSDGPSTGSVTFTNINDAPIISNLGGDAILATNDGTVVSLDANIAAELIDPDGAADFDGGTLTVTGAGFEVLDLLRIDTSGSVALVGGLADGSQVQVSGVTIGTLSGVSDSGLTISLNANASPSNVEAVLHSFTFESTSSTLGPRSVEIVVTDGDGILNGGNDTSQTATVSISVAQFGNGLIVTDEDTAHTFVASDFDFTGVVGSNLQKITITALPTNGDLLLNGVAVNVNDVITKTQIDAGQLTFVPELDANGLLYDNLSFSVNEGNSSITVLAGEPNAFTLGGGSLLPTDEILAEPGNFGIGGTVGAGISVAGTSATIDAAYLSQGDVFFNGFVPDGEWTAPELSAIDTWVQAGGILIATADSSTHDDLTSFYGLTIGGTGAATWNVVNGSHPIMNGPFGSVGATFNAAGAIGYFDVGSLSIGDQILAVDSGSGQPTVVLRQVGSGYVLFAADEGIFRANMTGSGTISTANDVLVANVFAWAVESVPTTETHTIDVNVNAINDDPTNSGSIATDVTLLEDVTTNLDLSSVDILDVDAAAGTMTVTLSVGNGILNAAASAGITISGNGSSTVSLEGSINDLNSYLDTTTNLQYTGELNRNGDDADVLTFTVNDNGNTGSGGGTPVNFGSVNIDITAVNDDPVNIGGLLPASVVLTEDVAADFDLSALVVDDVDVLAGNLTLTLSSASGATFASAGGTGITIGGNGTTTLTISGAIGDLNAFIADSTNVQITGAANVFGSNTDQVTVALRDNGNTGLGGGGAVAMGVVNVDINAVNDAAVASDLESAPVSYTENDGAVSLTDLITLADVDDTELESATIRISANYSSGEDLLSFVNTGNISGTFDALTGTLTLSGTDSIANYQSAIRSITYENSSNDPSTATRTVEYVFNDGDDDSVPVTRDIAITAVNDASVLSGIEIAPISYTENDGAVAISSTIVISDFDDTHIESAQIAISGNYVIGEDVLDFSNTANILGSFDALTGVLNLIGSDTLANYEAALQSVTYENLNNDPDTSVRTISFTVHDGDVNSNGVTRDINIGAVNDASVLSGIEGSALAYTENDAPTVITSTLTLSDFDDVNIESATVRISSNFINGEDLLSFSNTANISGSYDALTGILTLTGSDSIANYEAALRSVAYENSSENPSGLTRTISFTVNDGDVDSNIATRDIAVTPVNDAPIANADGPIIGNEAASFILTPLSNDIDFENDSMTITAINGSPIVAGGASLTVTGGEITLAADGMTLTFTPTVNFFGDADFSYTITDGNGLFGTATVDLDIVDTRAPGMPLVIITEDANDDGFINIAERIGGVDFTVTLPLGALEGESLSVNGVSQVLNATDIANGFVNGTLPAPSHNDTVSVSVYMFDPAGNTSATSVDVAYVDLVRPVVAGPLDLVTASDDGLSNNDNYTGDTTPTFRLGAGSGNPGDLVTVFANGVAVGTDYVNADGSADVTATINGFQIFKFTYTFTDTAGNESLPSIGLFVEFFDSALPYRPPTDPNILGVETISSGPSDPVIALPPTLNNSTDDDDDTEIPFQQSLIQTVAFDSEDSNNSRIVSYVDSSTDFNLRTVRQSELELDGVEISSYVGDLSFRVAQTHLTEDQSNAYQLNALVERLGHLGDELREELSDVSLLAGTATAGAGVVIAGYAFWVIRAVWIAGWVAATVPTFARFDPLALLDADGSSGESLAQIAQGK